MIKAHAPTKRRPAPSARPGPLGCRAHMNPLTLAAEQAQHLRGLVTGAAEPMRHPGVELGGLTRAQDQIAITDDEAHPAGEHVQPLVSVVRPGLRFGLRLRNHDLPVAGNVANPRAQVVTAAGEGSAAAIAINGDLVDDDVRHAVREFEHGRNA